MDTEEKNENLMRGARRAPIDIEFRNLSYNVGKKPILKAVGGKFKSGQLTGILGSSGAGKTTLLDILAGYTQSDVSGTIHVNGRPRSTGQFNKMAYYIRQEDPLQPLLTVHESMTIAANLKLADFSSEDKKSWISRNLSLLGLANSVHTQVEMLSGGERKRLAIALGLLHNPAVIFLDEPTTGLDNVSMKYCMQLLKSLALQGRTIVCTIHQPSDSLMQLFDTVYFMSDGFCIYSGTVRELVPFLSRADFLCPTNYNPTEYIMEVVYGQESNTLLLKRLANNGHLPSSLESPDEFDYYIDDGEEMEDLNNGLGDHLAASFWTQFSVLLWRNVIQLRRSRIALALHVGHNIVCGLLLGLPFYQVGVKADSVLVNLKYLYSILIYFLFTHAVAPMLLYPPEVKLLEREYFNRWYSLKAYFVAITVTVLPIITVTTMIFVILVYTLSGQPLEWYRFVLFSVICVLIAVTSQGFGYIIGALFNPTRGTVVGSTLMALLVLLGMQGFGYGDTLEPYMKRLIQFSFLYHGFVGVSTCVLQDRAMLECEGHFCYFGDANLALQVMGFADKSYSHSVLVLVLYFILHRIALYAFLRIRVAPGGAWFRNIKLFDLS